MAPKLNGPQLGTNCPNCERLCWVVAPRDAQPFLRTLRCPACGAAVKLDDTQPSNLFFSTGEIIQVDQRALPPPRFAIVVLQPPSDSQCRIKRVLGLPGEQIEFRNGELLVDSKIYTKDMSELLRLAVPVATLQDPIGRWSPEPESRDSASASASGGKQVIRLDTQRPLNWINQKPAPVHPAEVDPECWLQPDSIDDDLAQNAHASYTLQQVDDYGVQFQFAKPIQSECVLEFNYQQHCVRVRLCPQERNAAILASKGLEIQVGTRVEIAGCDGRILLRSDCQASFAREDWREMADQVPGTSAKFHLQCEEPITLLACRIFRDLYLRDDFPRMPRAKEAKRKSLGGYFVIGDNLVCSVDSRNSLGRVPAHAILGRVVESSD
ncbi:MAG: S26 family signal peptidase [Planctomycetota bacterium]